AREGRRRAHPHRRRGWHSFGRRRKSEDRGGGEPRAALHRVHLPRAAAHRRFAPRAQMIVGVPRETKEGERRVALLPLAVEEIAGEGHDVRVETRAGINVGFDDQAYRDAGADIVVARDVWDSDLIVKVKEVQPADLAVMP